MLALAFAALMLTQTPDVTPPEATPSDAVASSRRSSGPSRIISSRAPTVANVPTRTVCGWERTMDSNIQQRVCRKVAANSSQRERMSTEVVREMQGSRWGELPVARAPGGRPVG